MNWLSRQMEHPKKRRLIGQVTFFANMFFAFGSVAREFWAMAALNATAAIFVLHAMRKDEQIQAQLADVDSKIKAAEEQMHKELKEHEEHQDENPD